MAVNRDSLVRGIDFRSLEDAFSACQYPIESEQLVNCLGNQTIGRGTGGTQITEALEDLEGVFDSPQEVRAALLDETETGLDALGQHRSPTRQSESREHADRARRPPFKRPGEI